MKKAAWIICTVLFLNACSLVQNKDADTGKSVRKPGPHSDALNPKELLPLTEAELILGEKGHVKEVDANTSGGITTFNCTYEANATDVKTGKTGTLYCVYKQFKDSTSASNDYKSTKKANEGHEGIQVLNDVGNEAYYHTDGTNFYFIMARKGMRVFVMKVNKITGNTSLGAFNTVSRRVVERI